MKTIIFVYPDEDFDYNVLHDLLSMDNNINIKECSGFYEYDVRIDYVVADGKAFYSFDFFGKADTVIFLRESCLDEEDIKRMVDRYTENGFSSEELDQYDVWDTEECYTGWYYEFED